MDCRTVAALCMCWVECAVLGFVLYGWAPILNTFESDGIFADLCQYRNQTQVNSSEAWDKCAERDNRFNLAFTLGAVMIGVAAIPAGIIFDTYGLRTTRSITCVTSALGLLSWAFASPDTEWMVFSGCILNGITLMTTLLTSIHVAKLAGRLDYLLVAVYIGSAFSVTFWYSLVMILHNNNFHRKWSLLIITSLRIPSVLVTFRLLPKFKIDESDKNIDIKKITEVSVSSEISKNAKTENTSTECLEIQADNPPVNQMFRSSLFSSFYIVYIIWFCLGHLRNMAFLGTLVPWLQDLYPADDDRVSQFTSIFGFISVGNIFTSTLIAYISRKLESENKDQEDSFWGRARTAQVYLVFSSVFGVALSAANLGRSDWAVYTCLVLMMFYPPIMYSVMNTIHLKVFPVEHFGRLGGVRELIAAAFQFVQQPLIIWAGRDGFNNMMYFLLGTSMLTFLFPLIINIKSRRP